MSSLKRGKTQVNASSFFETLQLIGWGSACRDFSGLVAHGWNSTYYIPNDSGHLFEITLLKRNLDYSWETKQGSP